MIFIAIYISLINFCFEFDFNTEVKIVDSEDIKYHSLIELEEWPQPKDTSICTKNEFYQYFFTQIQQNIHFTQKCLTSVNSKIYIEVIIDKKGDIEIIDSNNNLFSIHIPNFETPAYLMSKPINIKFKFPVHICLR